MRGEPVRGKVRKPRGGASCAQTAKVLCLSIKTHGTELPLFNGGSMRARISSELPASADQVWSLVKRSSTLVYVTRGLLGFSGAEEFPRQWRQGMQVQTRLWFFGVLPGWRHHLTFKEISDTKRVQFTEEGAGWSRSGTTASKSRSAMLSAAATRMMW